MKATAGEIKKLRELTGAPVMEAKKVLEEISDFEKARGILMESQALKASKKTGREAREGLVVSYIHATGKIGSLVEVNCETDFVARTDDFKKLCQEVAMQVAAMPAESVEELLSQEYIRDGSRKVSDLVTEAIAKVGENIKISRVVRYKVGE